MLPCRHSNASIVRMHAFMDGWIYVCFSVQTCKRVAPKPSAPAALAAAAFASPNPCRHWGLSTRSERAMAGYATCWS
jgi:hypothetical protein